MERKLHHDPVFDIDTLQSKADVWKTSGSKRAFIEWSTGTGPVIFYYPDGDRAYGVKWTTDVATDGYNELYADFIEHKIVPNLVEAFKGCGIAAVVRCVDLQPLQVQRQRRRQIERAQASVAHH